MSATRQAFEMERERAKAGGYKTLWLLEDLTFQYAETIGELETILNAKLDSAEVYRLVGRAILKLQKAKETVLSIKRIFEKE